MTVYLVGAGPGDPELLTVKASRVLQGADVVLHDSLVDARVLGLAPAGALLIDVGKRCGARATAQSDINRLICYHAGAGGTVVRLKGGDPMIFGRADEELAALQAAGIACEVVPGVTAATAAAAALGLSLTKRQVSRALHILTGHGADGALPAHHWVALANAGGTLALYMGARQITGVAAHLIEAGLPPRTPAVAVESASLPAQRIIRGDIAGLGKALSEAPPLGPVIVLIGEALAGRRAALVEQIQFAADAAACAPAG